MKKIFNQLFLMGALATMLFTSCKKDENQVIFQGGNNPTLTANKADIITLTYLTKDQEAVKFMWTNPEYQFSNGISSQDVNYTIEIDTAGANFTSSHIKRVSVSKDLSVSFTQNQFNDFLLNQLELAVNRTYNIEVRVIASLANDKGKLYSNKMSFSTKTFSIPPKVTPPGTAPDYTDGHLFIVGNATPGGWSNPVPVPTQEFTKISSTVYELTVQLTGGNAYLFLPINGFWGAKYGAMGGNYSNNPNGDDFKPEGGDMIAPASSGMYKIVVDFQRGKFSVTRM